MTGLLLSLLGVGKFIKAHWPWFVAALVCVLLWFAWRSHERGVWNRGYNLGWSQQHAALEVEIEGHNITRASLSAALVQISDQTRATETLRAASVAKQAASDAKLKAALAVAAKAESTAKAFDASAARKLPKDAMCVPSDTFLANSGEL